MQVFAYLPRLPEDSAEELELRLAKGEVIDRANALETARQRLKHAKRLGDEALKLQCEQEYGQALSHARKALARMRAAELTVQALRSQSGGHPLAAHAAKVD
jgi:predicted S18 family serine protease